MNEEDHESVTDTFGLSDASGIAILRLALQCGTNVAGGRTEQPCGIRTRNSVNEQLPAERNVR